MSNGKQHLLYRFRHYFFYCWRMVMLTLTRIMHKTSVATILIVFLLIQGQTLFAADFYRVCSRTPNNNLNYVQQADGAIRYEFSGDLRCHEHFNYDAFHSLPHDDNYENGTYNVMAWFKGKTLHEKIWIDTPLDYGGAPAIDTIYSCSSDPFRNKTQCAQAKRTTPNESVWQGAVEEAAGFTVPLSIGLASKGTLEKIFGIPAGPHGAPAQQAGSLPAPDLYDIALNRVKYSDDRREYFFSFSLLSNGHYDKMEAMATKYIDGKRVDISIRGADHHIDLSYNCSSIMDPFLDPGNRCILTNTPSSLTDSLYLALVNNKKSFNLVKVFADTIPNSKRQQMRWEALAKSMQPAIFEGGKTQAPEGSKISFPSNADIVLEVESSRDIKRVADQPVSFHIEPAYGYEVSDIKGNIIAMPLSSKYTGNSYNGAVRTLKNLAPGKYTFFTSMMTSFTSEVKSKKIPFEVTSHVSPKQAPVISSPQENEKLKKGSAVSFKILVSQPMFGTGFDATLQCEHSRLATQESYKPLEEFAVKNQGKDSTIQSWHFFEDKQGNDVTGDFRCRAQMIWNGKPQGKWSEWRHFHVGGKAIPLMHRGFSILSPKKDTTFTDNIIPVTISLPEGMQEEDTLHLYWEAVSGPHAGNILTATTVTVKPGVMYEAKQDITAFSPSMNGSDGKIKLTAYLDKNKKHDIVIFSIPTLGIPASENQGQKKSGTLLLDTPIFTTPAEGQVFMAPAKVEVNMIHRPEVQVRTELAYCPFPKKKTAILAYQSLNIKPVVKKQKDKGTTTLVYELKKPGFYQIRAMNNGKLGVWSQWRSFKVDSLNSKTVSSVKLTTPQELASSKAPQILSPANHAVFQKDQSITVKINTHGITKPMTDEVQYKGEDKRFHLLFTGGAGQSKSGGVVETSLPLNDPHFQQQTSKASEYRIRVAFAHTDEKGYEGFLYPEEWSNWCYFSIIPRLKIPTQIPKKSFNPNIGVSAAQPHQIKTIGKLGNRSINPQSEPPGKQIRKISMPLAIMPHPRTFRPTGSIKIPVKNTPFSRVPFELRYRPAAGKPYRLVKTPSHSFSRTNGITSLHLNLKRQGEYQVRFRKNHKAPWTGWSSFQVLENPARTAALAQKMRMAPTASRMINPQPEPPGKVLNKHTLPHTTPRMTPTKKTPSLTPVNTTVKIHFSPPKIREPRNGQKFLLAGNIVHVKAKVEYTGREHIQVEVQQKKKGRYITLRPEIHLSKTGNITAADISLSATGSYRLRVRAGNNGRWSNWTTFTVDKLMKNMPTLRHSTPAVRNNKPIHTATPSIKPSLQPVR